MQSEPRPRHLVLWDGDCGFCRRCVRWLGDHDVFGALEFQPYQEAAISPELKAACSKAMHVITRQGQVLRAGRAALFCGRFTQFHKLARMLEWPIFLPFVEFGYGILARNRVFFSRLLYFI